MIMIWNHLFVYFCNHFLFSLCCISWFSDLYVSVSCLMILSLVQILQWYYSFLLEQKCPMRSSFTNANPVIFCRRQELNLQTGRNRNWDVEIWNLGKHTCCKRDNAQKIIPKSLTTLHKHVSVLWDDAME